MPRSAPRPCPHPGCRELIRGREGCPAGHGKQHKRDADRRRPNAHQRGYTHKWKKASAAYLAENPLCECPDCQAGRIRVLAASVVDHIIPHRGDKALFWDEDNWQAMAKSCHDRKTAREDGGFGNASGASQP